MNFKNNFFLPIALLFIFSLNLHAQNKASTPPANLDQNIMEAPSYDFETITIEELGFPTVLSAKQLGYQYALIWSEKDAVSTKKVYGAENLDQMPLFSSNCKAAKDMETCSNIALEEYLRTNIAYPEDAIVEGHDGLEKLFFVIDQNGKIEGNIKVISKDKPCDGCALAAVKAVANMPAWIPGMKNGQAVKSQVILPVKFSTK